jgi:hypothetical protein
MFDYLKAYPERFVAGYAVLFVPTRIDVGRTRPGTGFERPNGFDPEKANGPYIFPACIGAGVCPVVLLR